MNKLIFTLTLAATLGVVAGPDKGPKPGHKVVVIDRTPSSRIVDKPVPPQNKPGAKPQMGKPQMAKPQKAKPMPKQAGHRIEKSHHSFGARGAGSFMAPPNHTGFHANRPHGARYWGRPGLPPPMMGALTAWTWVATPWSYTVDGVYYYGEGYYFDGYNYCYNGGYHLTPPPVMVAQPVVTTPVVTTPVVTQPVVTTPPPPPRRGGFLGWLLGD